MLGIYATKFVGEFAKSNSKARKVDPGMAHHLSSLTNDPNMHAKLADELMQNCEPLIAEVVGWTRTGAKGPVVADDLNKAVAKILGVIAGRLVGRRARYPRGAGDLAKAIAELVYAITSIRVASAVPDLSWLLQGGRRDIIYHNRDLWNLRRAVSATFKKLSAHMAHYQRLPPDMANNDDRVRQQVLDKLSRGLMLVREALEELLPDEPPPPGRHRPKGTWTVQPWHIHIEEMADAVEAVFRADGYAKVSRTVKEGPFARMMAHALKAINGHTLETATIAAYLAHPREQRHWAIRYATFVFSPSRRIAGMQRVKE
jgi:hypothetical protein